MSINTVCVSCKRTFKLSTKTCTCGRILKVFKVRVKLPDGRWLTKQVDSLQLARKVESKFKTQKVEDDVFDIKRSPELQYAWDRYIAYAKTAKVSWRDDLSRWNHHVITQLNPATPMNKVTSSDINRVLDVMRDTHAPATVKQVLTLIRRVFNWSIKQGLYLGTNPCSRVESPRFDNRVTNVMSAEGLAEFIDTVNGCPNERFRLVVLFALFTGKRRGEILKLQFKDVDIDKGLVTYQGLTTKNGNTHTLPISQSGLRIILRCLEIRICDLVFPADTGEYYHSFDKTWHRFKKTHKLSFRFHDLRHQFATVLASSGKVDIYTLKELLGHKTLEMTQRYAHLTNDSLQKAVNVMDEHS
jgi:integrase